MAIDTGARTSPIAAVQCSAAHDGFDLRLSYNPMDIAKNFWQPSKLVSLITSIIEHLYIGDLAQP